jgi:hypothetical protein
MANPVFVDCPADTWQLVASNVTAGQVKKADNTPGQYLETYRTTGGAAPTEISEGIPCFVSRYSEPISASAGIDVYIMARGKDGRVRVDA